MAPTALPAPGASPAPAPSPGALRTLTVPEAIETALTRSPVIAAAARTADAAGARVRQAYAAYYPTIDLSLNDLRSGNESTVVVTQNVGTVNVDVGRTNYNAQLSLRQTLWDFSRRDLRVKAARETWQAALQDLERVRQDVTLNVRERFFAARTAQEVLGIRIQTVSARQARLDQARGFYEAGIRARIEVTKALADLAQAELDVVKARNALQVAWVQLNVAMGLPQDEQYNLVLAPPESLDDVSAPPLLQTAWRTRPELLNLQARIRAQVDQMEVFYRNRLPTISGTAAYGYSGPGFPLPEQWSVGLNLDLNLFNGFLDRYQAQEARFQAQSLVAQLEQQRQTVYQEVQTNYVTLREAQARIVAAQVSLQQARENFDLARQRYQVGLGSNLEYTDAQVLYVQAQTDLVSATNDYHTARARLERAVGVYNLRHLPPPPPPPSTRPSTPPEPAGAPPSTPPAPSPQPVPPGSVPRK